VFVIGIQAEFWWKLHARKRGHDARNPQDREPDSKRYSTFCWSSGQVREDDAILVSRLGQRSLDRMLPIHLACGAGSARLAQHLLIPEV
jgi:hypothetical protein